MSPPRILAFLLAVLALLALIGALVPRSGVHIGCTVFRAPDPLAVLFPSPKPKVDISDILAITTDDPAADTIPQAVLIETDTLPDTPIEVLRFDARHLPPLEERIALHFPAAGRAVLHPFFEALANAHRAERPIHILHYGDSQIEGDRITNHVRNKLQAQFGGQGPGLVAVADITPHFAVERFVGPEWKRYSVMDRRDSTLHHARFGALLAFSRFTPILEPAAPPPPIEHTATITLRPAPRAHHRATEWTVCRLFFGWHRAPVTIAVHRDGEPVASETIAPADSLLVRTWRFPAKTNELSLTFSGADSPDVFGISLEGPRGVVMDNLAVRGGAGYEFRKCDQDLMRAMFAAIDVRLLILQYGGNTLPNIRDSADAERYGRFFGGQVAAFRKMMPQAPVIVIGPSDMSIKEGDRFVTRPHLQAVRDAMKKNVLERGACFWDLYEVMGGEGSMVSWVEADPPLAATDFTHFSPAGAKKVGELFHTALIDAYAQWAREQEGKPKSGTAEVRKGEKVKR